MRTKDDLHEDLYNNVNWKDQDRSRKAHELAILIEVLIDIRDILRSEISGIARSLYVISKQP